MLRSKIEEIKSLRAISFKRPNAGNYLANPSRLQAGKFGIPKLLKINTIQEKQPFNCTQTNIKGLSNTRSPFQFTPDASRIRVDSPNKSTQNTQKLVQIGLRTELNNSFPYSTSEFVNKFKSQLKKYELAEILDYNTVFY